MAQTGKCTNYASCLLAYRNELVKVADDAPFVCPECRHALTPAIAASKRPGTVPILIVGGIVLLVAMGAAAVYYQARRLKELTPAGQTGSSFQQTEVAAAKSEFPLSRQPETITPGPAPTASESTTPAPPPAPQTADESGVRATAQNLDLQQSDNQRVKAEVLKRIDLMPNISADNKDKLYMSVDRARKMGQVMTIPFASGRTTLGPGDVEKLKQEMTSAPLQQLLQDPTCVFVILGFADPTGDEKTNLHLSLLRAQSVEAALRDQCGVANVLHSVGMGGSTLFGNTKDAERNRVAEIWAVLP